VKKIVNILILIRYLVNGDYLILDNASVHRDHHNLPILNDLLQANHIELIYLPTYSPELNPCELVFQYIKKTIKNRKQNGRLLDLVVQSISNITEEMMLEFYNHCCNVQIIRRRIDSGCV
jgi:transposase